MNFYNTKPGEICADYCVPAAYQSYPGIVHGGIIASMLDEVTGRVFMAVDEKRFMVTAKLSIRYRKPVPVEQPIRLIGKAGKDNGRVAMATGFLYDQDGNILAEADAVLVNFPSGNAPEEVAETFGWKVYPDEEESL